MQATVPQTRPWAATLRNSLYLLGLGGPLYVIAGNWLGGVWAWGYALGVLVLLPLAEPFLGRHEDEFSSQEATLPDALLLAHLVLTTLALGSLFIGIRLGILAEPWVLTGAILSTGVNAGSSGMVVAHEMIHRKGTVWQWGAKYLALLNLNWYYLPAHIQVHHKLVATHDDSTTARAGEHLFAFLWRAVMSETGETWRLEAARLRKAGKAPFGIRHYVIGSLLLMAALLTGVYLWLGWTGVLAWLGVALLANFLLEFTNYIQHYGLTRKADAKGIVERVAPAHAWASSHVTRFLLTDLPRHADHHMYGARPYHQLRHHAASPVLPTGYAGMIWIALVPPLFFHLMHKRLAMRNEQ